MGVSGTRIGFYILLSKASKEPIYYSPVGVQSDTVTPSLFF